MKQPPIQSTAGAVPVRNEKGECAGSGGAVSAGKRGAAGDGLAARR